MVIASRMERARATEVASDVSCFSVFIRIEM